MLNHADHHLRKETVMHFEVKQVRPVISDLGFQTKAVGTYTVVFFS